MEENFGQLLDLAKKKDKYLKTENYQNKNIFFDSLNEINLKTAKNGLVKLAFFINANYCVILIILKSSFTISKLRYLKNKNALYFTLMKNAKNLL